MNKIKQEILYRRYNKAKSEFVKTEQELRNAYITKLNILGLAAIKANESDIPKESFTAWDDFDELSNEILLVLGDATQIQISSIECKLGRKDSILD